MLSSFWVTLCTSGSRRGVVGHVCVPRPCFPFMTSGYSSFSVQFARDIRTMCMYASCSDYTYLRQGEVCDAAVNSGGQRPILDAFAQPPNNNRNTPCPVITGAETNSKHSVSTPAMTGPRKCTFLYRKPQSGQSLLQTDKSD